MSGDCVWKVGQVKNNVLAYWMMLVMHCPWSDEIYACVAGCRIGLKESGNILHFCSCVVKT